MSSYGSISGGAGGGSSTFAGLSDTPGNFSGASLQIVRVNAGETALEFASVSVGAVDDPVKIVRTFTAGVSVLDVVYQRSDGTVDVADADAGVANTIPVVGIVSAIDSPLVGECEIVTSGDLGGFSGLVAGKVYILSTAPGGIVADDDTGNGDYPSIVPASGDVFQEVGYAKDATTLLVGVLRDFDVS